MAPATYDPRIHHRRTIRLSGWDYSAAGSYFVTVCANSRACLFGEIIGGRMRPNEVGAVVVETWRWLSTQYTYVVLDEWCVMPNHLHGILTLTGRGGSRTAPTSDDAAGNPTDGGTTNNNVVAIPRKTVGRLIGAFKTVSTKNINLLRDTPGAVVWQRSFREHIVREAGEMDRIRDYICENPARWAADPMNPNSVTSRISK